MKPKYLLNQHRPRCKLKPVYVHGKQGIIVMESKEQVQIQFLDGKSDWFYKTEIDNAKTK